MKFTTLWTSVFVLILMASALAGLSAFAVGPSHSVAGSHDAQGGLRANALPDYQPVSQDAAIWLTASGSASVGSVGTGDWIVVGTIFTDTCASESGASPSDTLGNSWTNEECAEAGSAYGIIFWATNSTSAGSDTVSGVAYNSFAWVYSNVSGIDAGQAVDAAIPAAWTFVSAYNNESAVVISNTAATCAAFSPAPSSPWEVDSTGLGYCGAYGGVVAYDSPTIVTAATTNGADTGFESLSGMNSLALGIIGYYEIGGGVPAAPTGLTAGPFDTVEIALAWTNPAGPLTDNTIYEFSDSGCSDEIATIDLGGVATSYDVTGLTPDTVYGFEVSASNSTGESDLSACAGATTGGGGLATSPYQIGWTGATKGSPWVGYSANVWENVTGGTAPFTYTWTLLTNLTLNDWTVAPASFGNVSGQAMQSGEVNLTINATSLFTLVVNVTDSASGFAQEWFSTEQSFNPVEAFPTFSISLGIWSPTAYPANGSNNSYAGNVSIHTLVLGIPEGGAGDNCWAAGWSLYNATGLIHDTAMLANVGPNQTECASSTNPPLFDPITLNLSAGKYTIIAWVNDTDTQFNTTVVYQFVIYAGGSGGGGGGGPLPGFTAWWELGIVIILVVIAAVGYGLWERFGYGSRGNRWE